MSSVENAERTEAGERTPMFERMQPFEKTHSFENAPAYGDMAAAEPGERRSVFESLVTSDSDVVGLVAYSIYKQNKHDFLVSYGREFGRGPSEIELAAYTLGESTPRRLATYRHLAEATLDGRGLQAQPATLSRSAGAAGSDHPPASAFSMAVLINLLTLIVVIATFGWLVSRMGLGG